MRRLPVVLLLLILHQEMKAQPPWQWATLLDGHDAVRVLDIQPDSIDGCVLLVSFSSDIFLPTDTLHVTDGDPDGAIIKLNYAGHVAWAVQTSSPIKAMAPRSNGAWHFVVDHQGPFLIDGMVVAPASTDISLFSFALDNSGVLSEPHDLPNAVHLFGFSPRIDLGIGPREQIITSFIYVDSVYVESIALQGSMVGTAMAWIDTNGTVLWARWMMDGTSNYGFQVRMDTHGNTFVSTDGPFHLQPEDTLLGDQGTAIVASFDTTGAFRWSYSSPGDPFNPSQGSVMRVCSNGDVLFAYDYNATTLVLYRFNGAGDSLGVVATSTESAYFFTPTTPYPLNDGGVMVGGNFAGSLTFGGDVLTNATPNCFVAAANANNQWDWALTGNGPGNVFGTTVVADPAGRIFGAGWFEIHADFGPFHLLPVGGDACFVFCMSSLPLAIKETRLPRQLTVWPDPARNELHLALEAANTSSACRIFNASGMSIPFHWTSSSAIDVQMLPAGLYMIIVGDRAARFIKE